MSELVMAEDMSGVISADAGCLSVSDVSNNCPSSEPVDHGDHESMQCQLALMPELETEDGKGKMPEKLEVESRNAADVTSVMQSLTGFGSELTTTDVSEQIASLHCSIASMKASNDELRQIVDNGMTKVTELEVAYAKSVARNKELEQQLLRLSGTSERTVTDIALLSTSLSQIAARIDKPSDAKTTTAAGDGSNAMTTGVETDISSLLPTFEQRVAELEVQVQQSATRFGEFATALDSIEHDLQRYIRRHSLVVENLCPKEDRSASDAFLIFVNSVLEVAVDDSDIDGYHLLDRTSENGATATSSKSPEKKIDHRPRPLLITFTCYRTRTQVYKVDFNMLTNGQC